MDKTTQDFAWASLPKEARTELIAIFNMPSKYGYSDSVRNLLIDIYGGNLTSDTEPKEMLMTEREKVMGFYNICKGRGEEIALFTMKYLFGDKCLPDKQPSVQVEPKFKVGDIVRVKYIPIYEGEIGIIDEIGSRIIEYHLKGNKTLKNDWFAESYLELYTEPSKVEPKFRKGDKVKIADEKVSTFGNIATITHCEVDEGKVFYWLNDDIGYYSEHQLEPYTEPEAKDNMEEEKELNLCELLKGCEGEKFYSPITGFEMVLKGAIGDYLLFKGTDFQCHADGRMYANGHIVLWPSRALYEKYPLDAYSAWMEWKRQRAVEVNEVFCFALPVVGNCWELKVRAKYSSEEEVLQATEIVKEALDKFHKQNAK